MSVRQGASSIYNPEDKTSKGYSRQIGGKWGEVSTMQKAQPGWCIHIEGLLVASSRVLPRLESSVSIKGMSRARDSPATA